MEKFNELLNFLINKNLIAVMIILAVTFGGGAFGYYVIYDKVTKFIELQQQNADSKTKLADLENQQKAEMLKAQQEKGKIQSVPVKIFKSSTPGLPVESASVDFVSSVINKLEKTQNSIMDISYKIDESAKTDIPSNVSVVQLVMRLNGTYSSFQDFIFNLYDNDYLATIKSLKIVPLKENKNILDINIVILLYVSK